MKTFLFVTFILGPLTGFCCSPETQIKGEALLIGGLLNRLTSLERFKDYEIKSITKTDFSYLAMLMKEDEQKCAALSLEAFVTGSCDSFTATITNERIVEYSQCQ